jgi:hypothetical protein
VPFSSLPLSLPSLSTFVSLSSLSVSLSIPPSLCLYPVLLRPRLMRECIASAPGNDDINPYLSLPEPMDRAEQWPPVVLQYPYAPIYIVMPWPARALLSHCPPPTSIVFFCPPSLTNSLFSIPSDGDDARLLEQRSEVRGGGRSVNTVCREIGQRQKVAEGSSPRETTRIASNSRTETESSSSN